nr:probable calcium-binding protein CML30 [Ipomoea batatas]
MKVDKTLFPYCSVNRDNQESLCLGNNHKVSMTTTQAHNKAIADGVECRENNDDELFVVDGLINTRVCLEEVSHLFDENEPSFEEIKETFDMFDEDGDGYIDEKDLGKLLFRIMGFCEFSQQDCRGMIKAFDENKDGRIDIGEFLKLMEDSFD